jgi:hypothetical protein
MSSVVIALLAMSALAIELAIVHMLERRWLFARGERQKLRSQASARHREARSWAGIARSG